MKYIEKWSWINISFFRMVCCLFCLWAICFFLFLKRLSMSVCDYLMSFVNEQKSISFQFFLELCTSTNCTAIAVKTSVFIPKMPSQMICRSLFNPKCFTPVPPLVSDRWGAPAMLHISLLLMLLWGYKKLTPFIPWLVVIYVLPLSWCRKKPLSL